MIFSALKKNGFWDLLGPPYYGIIATIRICREMRCLPYVGFFKDGLGVNIFENLNKEKKSFNLTHPYSIFKVI